MEDNVVSEHGGGASTADTDLTSISNGIQSLGVSEGSSESDLAHGLDQTRRKNLIGADEDTTIVLLQEMFPSANTYTVKHTLRKCDGNWERAMEEMLNHAFFNDQVDGEEKLSHRSIDAFSDDSMHKRAAKAKKKDKRKGRSLEIDRETTVFSDNAPPQSAWASSAKDISFLSNKLNLPTTTLTSLYHQNGLSLPRTVVALLDSPALAATTGIPPDDPVVMIQAADLMQEFPIINRKHAVALVRLTSPSTVAAHEVAKALATHSQASNPYGLDIVRHYAPLDLSDEGSQPSTPTRTRSPAPYIANAHMTDHSTLSSIYNNSASNAFGQASAAYRKSRSDHLMGGAAAYYSQMGRDYASARAEASAGAADELVSAQSPRPNQEIDLHGVTVKDAVRIAKTRTEGWWKAKGGRGTMGYDGRMARGGGGDFRIVTGVGHHSTGGRGKIGPAVARMLVGAGWRFEIGAGVVTVTGKENGR